MARILALNLLIDRFDVAVEFTAFCTATASCQTSIAFPLDGFCLFKLRPEAQQLYLSEASCASSSLSRRQACHPSRTFFRDSIAAPIAACGGNVECLFILHTVKRVLHLRLDLFDEIAEKNQAQSGWHS